MKNSQLLVVCMLILGCSDEKSPHIGGVIATVNETIPTVIDISFESTVEGTSWVEFGANNNFSNATPVGASGMSHVHTVIGMAAGSTVDLMPLLETSSGDIINGSPVQVKLPPTPDAFPKMTRTVDTADAEMNERYLLAAITVEQVNWIVIYNSDGHPVWHHDQGGSDAQISGDGSGLIWLKGQYQVPLDPDKPIVQMTLEGDITQQSIAPDAHHRFIQHPDGSLAYLAYESHAVDIEESQYLFYSDTLNIGTSGQKQVKTAPLFSVYDQYTTDPSFICSHVEDEFQGGHEWTHSNSLIYSEEESAYFVMARHLDALFKIDAHSGALIWELGGENNAFTGLSVEQAFDHAHTSWYHDGKLLVFDNGAHREDAVSRVVEYTLDEVAMTAALTWEYQDPMDRYTHGPADIRPMPDGNLLISLAENGELFEVTRDGEIVWQMNLIANGTISSITALDQNLYELTEAMP